MVEDKKIYEDGYEIVDGRKVAIYTEYGRKKFEDKIRSICRPARSLNDIYRAKPTPTETTNTGEK